MKQITKLSFREPTPDQHQLNTSRHQRLLLSLRLKKKPRVRLQEEGKRPADAEEERTRLYLEFLDRVTRSILARGIYTDKGLREAISYEMTRSSEVTLRRVEVERLLTSLRQELGMEHKTSSGLSGQLLIQ